MRKSLLWRQGDTPTEIQAIVNLAQVCRTPGARVEVYTDPYFVREQAAEIGERLTAETQEPARPSEPRKRAPRGLTLQDAIKTAINEKWGGIPRLRAKERNPIINEMLEKEGFKIPESAAESTARDKAINVAIRSMMQFGRSFEPFELVRTSSTKFTKFEDALDFCAYRDSRLSTSESDYAQD